MRKYYVSPEAEMIVVSMADVLTESGSGSIVLPDEEFSEK